jgi:hypothetical protein
MGDVDLFVLVRHLIGVGVLWVGLKKKKYFCLM